MCSEDKPDYKFLVFHPELILSVEFFHIVYDTPNPRPCPERSVTGIPSVNTGIICTGFFTMSSRCPAFSDRDSSILRLLSGELLYRMHGIFQYIRQDRTEHHSEQGSFSPIVTCVSQGIFCSSNRVLYVDSTEFTISFLQYALMTVSS